MNTESSSSDGTMIANLAQFDLTREIAESESKRPWQSGHIAKTLFKKSDFRVVLISMDKGAVLKEHHVDGTISVQVLKGSIRFSTQQDTLTAHSNSVLTLATSIKHQVEALEDSAFLLTIAWPDSDKLQAMTHRGYGS